MKFSIILFALFCVAAGQTDNSTSVASNGSTATEEPSPSPTSVDKKTTTADKTTAVATTGAPSTTPSPTTTPIPNNWERTNTYNYTNDNGTVCLLAKFAAHFEKDKKIWNVTQDAEMANTTDCGKLSVKFDNNKFELVFNQTSKGASYLYAVSTVLDNGKEEINAFKTGLNLAKASNGSSYMCLSGFPVSLSENVTMYLKEVQFQAFYVKGATFGAAQKCDSDLSPLVPIIVGAVLAGLVIIVVVAYFIGRNRNRVGYEEI